MLHLKKKLKPPHHSYMPLQPSHQLWDTSLKEPGNYFCHRLGCEICRMILTFLHVANKKRCIFRLFTYHLKAHTINNKLLSKLSAPKSGKKTYDSYKYMLKYWWLQEWSPLIHSMSKLGMISAFITGSSLG